MMHPLFSIIPFLISFSIGSLLVSVLFHKNKPMSRAAHFFLSGGLGLGASAHITFYSFLLLGNLHKGFIILGNAVVLILLFSFWLYLTLRREGLPSLNLKNLKIAQLFPLALLAVASVFFWIQANFFPLGGWDAWSCWNLKSKFLFLGGDHWQNMFDPLLWRSSPHYPLLLPLMNVWGWVCLGESSYRIPLLTSILFSLLTAGLLFSALKTFTGKVIPAFLGASLVATLPFFITLGTSQYSDIVVSYFLLASLFSFTAAIKTGQKSFLLLAGLSLGFLSFAKSEGTVAAGAVFFFAGSYLLLSKRNRERLGLNSVFYLLAGLALTSLPTVLFQFFYAPPNQTFTSGLLSLFTRAGLYRLKAIMVFFAVELISNKWNGIWIMVLTGLLLSGKKCFTEERIVFPFFFVAYGVMVIFYYWLNTYFEILWWLSVTLNRLLFSLLPTAVLWVFSSLWQDNNNQKQS